MIILLNLKIILCKCLNCFLEMINIYKLFRTSSDDLTPFKKLMTLVTDELKQQSLLASEVFPEKMDAFYLFVDRVFEDVVK